MNPAEDDKDVSVADWPQPRANDYDAHAAAYAAENDDSLANAHYERPAMLALAGEVEGRMILDAGCGSGALSAALLGRGAIVTGMDASAGMVELAASRLGHEASLLVADLSEPLPLADGVFDDVIASLVLHYLEDWTPALSEMRRVLRPGGRLLVSVDHPTVAYCTGNPRPDYFATTSYEFEWVLGGQQMPMRFWRRSLQTMLDAFTAAGFALRTISEPQPVPEARQAFPDEFAHFSTAPSFMFFALDAQQGQLASRDDPLRDDGLRQVQTCRRCR